MGLTGGAAGAGVLDRAATPFELIASRFQFSTSVAAISRVTDGHPKRRSVSVRLAISPPTRSGTALTFIEQLGRSDDARVSPDLAESHERVQTDRELFQDLQSANNRCGRRTHCQTKREIFEKQSAKLIRLFLMPEFARREDGNISMIMLATGCAVSALIAGGDACVIQSEPSKGQADSAPATA